MGKNKSLNLFDILSVYKQKKLHSPLILFVPGNCDKSGALAGKCPVSNTRCVLVLMV